MEFTLSKEPKFFHCNYCLYKTKFRFNLKTHIRIHTGEMTYKCESCEYVAVQYTTMKRHMSRYHDSDQIPKKFEDIGKEEKKREEKPFLCSFPGCDKKSSSMFGINVHYRYHIMERKIVCDLCDAKFTSPIQQRFHRRSHFSPGYDEEFKSIIRQEEKFNTPRVGFNCKECNRRFDARNNWIKHRQTHFDKVWQVRMNENSDIDFDTLDDVVTKKEEQQEEDFNTIHLDTVKVIKEEEDEVIGIDNVEDVDIKEENLYE